MPEPLFSVIIPTFARPERLRDCLSAVARLEAGGDFEVVVVDEKLGITMTEIIKAQNN